ncbi:MAG: hypothetical protein ACE5H9_10845 [Anaerolineae bacterium]
MEKVINEFKVVETDDGFRIEIKGDKEAIRRMLGIFGGKSPFGPKGPFGRGFGFGFGPRFWAGFGCCDAWGWAKEDEESSQKTARA